MNEEVEVCEQPTRDISCSSPELKIGELGDKLCLYRKHSMAIVAYTERGWLKIKSKSFGCGEINGSEVVVLAQFLQMANVKIEKWVNDNDKNKDKK